MANNIVDCNVEKCVHNMGGACGAQYIHVVGYNTQSSYETDCHTFELRNFRSSITNISNVNVTGVVDQIFTEDPVMNPDIKCSVKECIYNHSMMCTADEIKVRDYDAAMISQTQCKTFKKR